MRTPEKKSGSYLWIKTKTLLDLFLRFYYLLEIKTFEFLVSENFGRKPGNIFSRHCNIQISRNCFLKQSCGGVLWQEHKLRVFNASEKN